MADVVTLGVGVDTSQVRRATDDLEKMGKAGKGAAEEISATEAQLRNAAIQGQVFGQQITEVINTVGRLVKSFYDLGIELGNYQDLAETTSSDPAGLASLKVAADVAKVPLESIGLSMNRLALQLNVGDAEDNKASRALKAINIDVEHFRTLRADEQYRAIGTAMNKFADDTDKVAVAQELFGRGGAQNIRMFKEMAESGAENNLITNEMIKRADDLSDAMTRNRSRTHELLSMYSAELLPAVSGVYTAVGKLAADFLNAGTEAEKLARRKELGEWAWNVAIGVGYAVDVLRGFALTVTLVAKDLAAAMAQAAVLMDFSIPFAQRLRLMKNIDAEYTAEVKAMVLNHKSLADEIKKARDDAKAAEDFVGPIDQAEQPTKKIGPTGSDKIQAAKAEHDYYAELIARINEKIKIQQVEIQIGRELTATEKERFSAEKDMASHEADFATPAKRAAVYALLDQNTALQRTIDTSRAAVKQYEEEAQRNAASAAAAENAAAADTKRAEGAEKALRNYSLTREQIDQLNAAELRNEAIEKRKFLLTGELTLDQIRYTTAIEDQAQALERVADAQDKLNAQRAADAANPALGAQRALQEYVDLAKNAGEETKRAIGGGISQLEDGLTSMVAKQKLDYSSLIDYMISETVRLTIIRPLLQGIFGGSGGLLSLLFSGGGGGGGGGSVIDAGTPIGESTFAAGGEDYVPYDGKQYTLHKGERVLTAAENSGGKVMGTTINHTTVVNVDARTDSAQIEYTVARATAEGNQALLRELHAAGVY